MIGNASVPTTPTEPVGGGEKVALPVWMRARRARFALSVVLRLSIVAFLGYRAYWYAPEPSRDLMRVGFLVAPVFFLVRWVVGHRRIVRRFADGTGTPLSHDPAMLARFGIRQLTVIARRSDRGVGRSYRRGHRAWVSLVPASPEPLFVNFLVAHEFAHLVRSDSTRRLVSTSVFLGLLYGALATLSLHVIAAAALAILVCMTVTNWCIEVACDRLAVRRVGIAGIDVFVAVLDRMRSTPANGTVKARLRRARGVLTHPPLRLRRAIQRRWDRAAHQPPDIPASG